ncbi:MAG: PGF-pre-PGF domain-containing protein [Nanoarchaeota archaeon]
MWPLKFIIILIAIALIVIPISANTVDPSAVCGNNEKELGEQCDGLDSELCVDRCKSTCECPENTRDRTDVPNYRETIFLDKLNVNKVYFINSSQTQFPLISLSFKMLKDTKNVTIHFDPNLTAIDKVKKPKGVIYEYFNTSTFAPSLNSTHIARYTIAYKIDKNWIANKQIKQETIDLVYLKSAEEWESISAVKTYEDSKYNYYQSVFQSGDFHTFAIVGDNKTETISIQNPICGDGEQQDGETSANCCIDAGCPVNQYCIGTVCRETNLCGNNICEKTETLFNCPADCSRDILLSPGYFFLVSIIILTGILALKWFISRREHQKSVTKYTKWRKSNQ